MPNRAPRKGESFADLYPEQAAEWHPTRNGGLTPAGLGPHSNRRCWWRCACGNEWQTTVANRTAKRARGCRSCSSTQRWLKPPTDGQTLAHLFPDLAREWKECTTRPELTSETTRPGSHARVRWVCRDCGHEWEAEVRKRTSPPCGGCPPCAYRRVGEAQRKPDPGKSLASLRPDVAAEWHPTLNLPLRPTDVRFASGQNVWWQCASGHVWETKVAQRTTGKQTQCPECSLRQKHLPDKGLSLAELHPMIAAEWDIERNPGVTPATVKPGSARKVWWRCPECGYSYQASVGSRALKGTGCEPCSYRTRGPLIGKPKAGESLAERFPDIAAQWHPSKNGNRHPGEVKAGSDMTAWWVCERGHTWKTPVFTRTGPRKYGCPECKHLPAPGQSFADRYPSVAAQWHPTKNGTLDPNAVEPGSTRKVWWKCTFGHEWRATVSNRARGSGCRFCSLWGTSAQEIRLRHELEAAGCPVAHEHSVIDVVGRRPVEADIALNDWRVVVEFDGARHHRGADAEARDHRQTGALMAAGWTVIRVREAPLSLLTPNDIVVRQGISAKLTALAVLEKLESLGHTPPKLSVYRDDPSPWGTVAADKFMQQLRSRSLSTLFPEIAREWDPTKNGERSPDCTNPGSKESAHWICAECGHGWSTSPKHRTSDGTGCPACAARARGTNRSTPLPGQSLADLRPELLRIWHPERNGNLTLHALKPKTSRKFWWRCPACGREWQTAPSNAGCRACAVKQRAEKRRTPAPGHSLADLHPTIAAQWHPTKNAPLTPDQINPGTTRRMWWLCEICGREWQTNAANRVRGKTGCPSCGARRR
jgi:rubrerythrin